MSYIAHTYTNTGVLLALSNRRSFKIVEENRMGSSNSMKWKLVPVTY